MRNLTLFFTVVLLSFSCGSAKETDQQPSENEIMARKAFIGEPKKNNSSTEISNAVMNGNILKLTVSYSGGCEEQEFDLVGNEMIMKSLPPKRSIVLVRDSKGDACRECITKQLYFDVSELSYQKKAGSEIMLQLSGFEGEIRYAFQEEK